MKLKNFLSLGAFLLTCGLLSAAATVRTIPAEKSADGTLDTTITSAVCETTTEEETVIIETETETETEIITTTKAIETTTRATIKESKTSMHVPSEISNFKSYMDYRTITRGAQLELQKQAYTDANGCRKVGNYFCIALGSYYGSEIGAKYRIHLSDGTSFLGILADQKADKDTNATNQYTIYNRDIIEFVVDTNCLPSAVQLSGSLSSLEKFEGKVVGIDKL